MDQQKFTEYIQAGYTYKGESIDLGTAMLNGQCVSGLKVGAPLKTFNRHGLIAGATGTGKTKTLQVLAEELSAKGVPVLMMDIKGDLSGIATAGKSNPKIEERIAQMGLEWSPSGFPVELLTLSDEPGTRLRATVSEFGPVLFSKMLSLNDTQAGIVAVLFKYCDDQKLPLLDLKDIKKAIQFASNEGKKELEEHYGRISENSLSIVLRKIIELEQQGADRFFGEKSFEVNDLLRTDAGGRGIISVLRLTDLQDKPKLFSTFMLCLLAEIYRDFPEEGDSGKPKLVLFIDEAHLIFEEASKALLDQIETIVKLIRSKGVGIFFCTQNPQDVPEDILAQLGMKIQHALRAFTPKDRKQIKLTAENFPISPFYDTETVLTNLGMGEALVTVLNEKGIPTPLCVSMMRPPRSRMDVLSELEINDLISRSELIATYNQVIDRESAFEMLSKKLEAATEPPIQSSQETTTPSPDTPDKGMLEQGADMIGSFSKSTAGKIVIREVTRSLLGILGFTGTGKRRAR